MEDKNIFEKDRFFPNGIDDYHTYSLDELIDIISDKSGYIRGRVLVELAYRGQIDQVLNELSKIENQKLNSLFNMSVSQIAGLSVVDYGKNNDIEELKILVDEWTEKYQKEDFIDYLKRNQIYW